MKEKLTQEELKKRLHYNPDTGVFTWLVCKGGGRKSGDIAGGLDKNGYVQIGFNGKRYLAQRLACLYMEGYFPEHEMDHKFGIRHDNRWSRIRHVAHVCNMQNQKIRSGNESGFPGVSWPKHCNKWLSRININGKAINLGYHKTALDAALARFTFEMQCPDWSCNYRSELAKAIKRAWPEFKFGKRRKIVVKA